MQFNGSSHKFQRHELRSNRRTLTDHVTDHVVVVQTLNGTLNVSDVRVNSQDVNDVNYVNDSEAFPVNIQQPKYIFFNRVPKCGSTGIKVQTPKIKKSIFPPQAMRDL